MVKQISIGKVIELFENWVPKKLASEWDNVGLQVGSLSIRVTNVLVTLDVTEDVIKEALEVGANLIISHHPLIFKPLKQIDYRDPKGKIIQQLIKHDLTVYSAHTNLDVVSGGVNDLLADKLQLEQTKILVPEDADSQYGLGRVGTLKEAISLKQLAVKLKEIFQVEGLRVTGPLDEQVKKVAILGGSGEKYYPYAKRLGADVYITGDVSFHFAQDAEAAGLSIIDPGHHVERIMIAAVADYLRGQVDRSINVVESKISTEPFQFL